MTTRCEKIWVTAEGEKIPFSKVTHQHWSNIYWYHMVFSELPGMSFHNMSKTFVMAFDMINDNFGRNILPWKPQFEFELNWLHYLGLVKEGKIIFENEIIGEINGQLKFVPGVKLFELN